MEWLAEGISDGGWKNLENELITTIHSVPLKWTSVIRRMAGACDYFRRATRGDLPVEDDESSKEEDADDTNLDYEEESELD